MKQLSTHGPAVNHCLYNQGCLVVLAFILALSPFNLIAKHTVQKPDYQWTVIGAGPAGITAIGLLCELGIKKRSIAWVDPEFHVGRLGKYYGTVTANVPNKKFVQFLKSCKTFQEIETYSIRHLFALNPEQEYPLQTIIDPLQDITEYLKSKIAVKKGNLVNLMCENKTWHLYLNDATRLTSKYVILATGSRPKSLNYDPGKEISLDYALDKATLKQLVTQEDTVGVFGSSHSAILILKSLTELTVKKIINFYKHPLMFEKEEKGLLGEAEHWAKMVLMKNPPAHLLRVYNTDQALQKYLPQCSKMIYAIGYEPDSTMLVNGKTITTYDDVNGVIGKRLFGIGIAFPETFVDEDNQKVAKVGLVSFMNYAKRIMPAWIQSRTSPCHFKNFESIIQITAL